MDWFDVDSHDTESDWDSELEHITGECECCGHIAVDDWEYCDDCMNGECVNCEDLNEE